MSQYDMASLVFEAGSEGISAKKLIRKSGLSEGTCRSNLITLSEKDIVDSENDMYYPHPDATEEDLERIRPRTISELREDS
jgi:DNA-binding IclR family transcriptional regulator